MTTASIVDGDVAAEIVLAASRFAVWDDDTARAAFERETGQYVPSSEQLASVIQAVFWASMGQEEGRPALTRVCLANVRDPACSLQCPRQVSPHELCKLSPVTDASENFLLVSRDGEVVGFSRSVLPASVCIVAQAPGRLAVVQSDRNLAVLDDGEWHTHCSDPAAVKQVLRGILPASEFRLGFAQAEFFIELALRASAARRGAAFVLIPAEGASFLEAGYEVKSFPAAADAFAEWQEMRNKPVATSDPLHAMAMETPHVLRDFALRLTSAIAGIDGATVLEVPSLRLLRFGAKITAPSAASGPEFALIEFGPSSERRSISKRDLGGMRHQSAANLVQSNHDATVITVSQDGAISIFTWLTEEKRIAVVRHIERAFAATKVWAL